MPLIGHQGRGQRTAVNNSGTSSLFKYGGSDDDNDDDIVVYYWSPPDKNVRNTSGNLEQTGRGSVTVDQQQHQQMHLLATSSFAQSPVHSAAVVLTIAGMRL